MNARRGTCPGLADPMPTGDGLLARLAVARAISLDALAALCAAAQTHGNGIMEITSRGSLQVRGLSAKSAPAFAAAVETIDIADAAGGRVLASPLAGLDPHEISDVSGIIDRLRELLVESGLAAKLAPKVSIVVDGGGALHLEAVPCDIRLRAELASGGVHFHVSLASDRTNEMTLGTFAPERAAETVLELLHAIAAHGPTGRARDLLPLSTFPHAVNATRAGVPAQPIGTHGLRDGSSAIGVGLPFGHSDADTLQSLIDEARAAGAASARPAPDRALLLIGVAPVQASRLLAKAEQLGFLSTPNDPRRRVVACAGAPACAAAQIPTRALAPAIAAAALFGNQATIHVSGCAKGCAHSAPADLTIVGIGGKCGLVPNGRAQEAPVEVVSAGDLLGHIARRAAEREVAHG
jgi:precorrin-3B synthase